MISRPIRTFFGKGMKPALKKQESQSSFSSKTTALTEFSCGSFETCPESTEFTSCLADKSVSFQLDEYDDVVAHVYEYPAIEEEKKTELFWSQDEVAARRQARDDMVKTDCQDRSRFIACVEELFQVPMRKRQSVNDESVPSMDQEAAIQGLIETDYRGYEERCCRDIVALRKYVVRKILASHWVRGSKQIDQISFNLSQRQVQFARLVAEADAKFAAEYLSH